MDNLNIDNFTFNFSSADTIFALTVNKSIFKEKKNMLNITGKMAVVHHPEYSIYFSEFLDILDKVCNIKSLIIISINLIEDLNYEKFYFEGNNCKITYLEVGIIKFIETLNEDPKGF
jgi:hypothetical protein